MICNESGILLLTIHKSVVMVKMDVYIFLLVVVLPAIQGSQLKFSASPAIFKTDLTEAASMRCEVTAAVSSGTHDDVDVRHVTSLLVTYQGGKDVASVTSSDPVMTFVDQGNLQAKGSISGTSGESYLELTWQAPANMSLGEYECHVVATDGRGHLVYLSKELFLSTVEPSISDVIEVFNMKHEMQQQQINFQLQENKNYQQQIQQQQQEITQQQQQITQQQQENTQQQQQITQLQQQLNNTYSHITKLETCVSKRVAFAATFTSSGSFQRKVGDIIVFDKILLNEGSAYSSSDGQFRCQQPGIYSFELHIMLSNGHINCLQLRQNGQVITSVFHSASSNYEGDSTGASLSLKQGDVVDVCGRCSSSNFYQNTDSVVNGNIFSGRLIHADECLSLKP